MEGQFEWVRGLGKGVTIIAGSFAPAGAGAVTDQKGRGFTVARTSAGLFTITFTGRFGDFIAFIPGLQLAAGDDKFVQMGTYTAASRTLTLRVWDVSVPAETDVAANANNRINFIAVFKNSSAPK